MFSQRLKELRREKGMKQSYVAELIGSSNRSISSYEVGNSEPSLSTVKKLSDLFDVSVDYLVGQTDIKKIDCNYIIDSVSSQVDNAATATSALQETINRLKGTKKE